MKLVKSALETVSRSEKLVDEDGFPTIPKSWTEKTFLALILDAKKHA